MVNLRLKLDLGWLEGIVRGEVDVQKEDAAVVGRVLGPHDRRGPGEQVRLLDGSGRAVSGRVLVEIRQLLLDSLLCHAKEMFLFLRI